MGPSYGRLTPAARQMTSIIKAHYGAELRPVYTGRSPNDIDHQGTLWGRVTAGLHRPLAKWLRFRQFIEADLGVFTFLAIGESLEKFAIDV